MNMTFEKAYLEYLEYAKLRQKPTSLLTFKNKMEKNFLPYFKKKKIKHFKIEDYAKWQSEITKLGYSYTYRRNLHYCVCSIYEFLMNFYNVKKNIPKIVGNFKDDYYSTPKVDFWTYEEYKKFIQKVDNIVFYTIFELLYFTGCRKGEALALTFNDIEDDQITINKTISKERFNGKRIIMNPKTKKSIRKIQIDSKLKENIKKLQEYYISCYGYFSKDFYIFGGIKPLSTTTLERKKNEYCELAEVKKIRIHDFRHSHATLLYNLNIPIDVISKRLGHSSITTTLNVYIHGNDEQEKRAIQLLSSMK